MITNWKTRVFQALTAAALLLLCVYSLAYSSTYEQGKNGVAPTVISLPKGPGSIEGLGQGFKPSLNTGTSQYEIIIKLPPGVNGHTPTLSLQYNAGYGAGPIAIGWRFGPRPIQRQVSKGLPRYVDANNNYDDDHDGHIDEVDEMDRFIGPDGEELVQIENGVFRAEVETNFTRYERDPNGCQWTVCLRDGTLLMYGGNSTCCIDDGKGRVFQWLLRTGTDTNGNIIRYDYTGDDPSRQKYLQQISYGAGKGPWSAFYFVYLDYEERNDVRRDCLPGFILSTRKRLKSITVGVQQDKSDRANDLTGDINRDGILDSRICTYQLRYDYDPQLIHSRLRTVTCFGADGKTALPPIRFDYRAPARDEVIFAEADLIVCNNEPSLVVDSDHAALIDLNADSLPDVLITDPGGRKPQVVLNQGMRRAVAGERKLHWADPVPVNCMDGFSAGLDLSDGKVHLADMDGDGKADLVNTTAWKEIFYHRNNGRLSWGLRARMTGADVNPPAPFAYKEVRLSDLDFDKRIDVVQSTDHTYLVWFNLGDGKYSRKVETGGARYNNHVISLSEKTVHLADLNGDRLNDIVRIAPSRLICCLNMGYGRFDEAIEIPIPDQALTSGPQGQIERARLEDINADGLADLVIERAAINELWCWLNRGTDQLTRRIRVVNMPRIYDVRTVVRWADMNANGTVDLVYACSFTEPRLRIVDIGELIGGSGHPSLLAEIDNSIGAKTKITYTSSTNMYVQDWHSDDPWPTCLPFPVQVVSDVTTEVATVDGTESYMESYKYWGGYYDVNEQEFWGFARETTDQTGDANAPSVRTVNVFHAGRQHKCLKGKVKAVELRDVNDVPYYREDNAWEPRVLRVGIDGREAVFPQIHDTFRRVYEGQLAPKSLYTTYEYDEYGNMTAERKYGLVGMDFDPDKIPKATNLLNEANDEILISREYLNDTENWMLDRLTRETISDINNMKQAEALFDYDSHGNLVDQYSWLNTKNSLVKTIHNDYDSYGNITSVTNALGRRRSIAYDSTFHTYPVNETIHLESHDLKLTAEYDLVLGLIKRLIDYSGAQTDYRHDALGRLISIRGPEGAEERYAYELASPVSRIHKRVRDVDNADDTTDAAYFHAYSYFDGLGRKLGDKIEGEDERWSFVDAVAFNARGLDAYKWLAHFTDTHEYEIPVLHDPNRPYISLKYDVRDRVIRTDNFDGTYSKVVHEPLVQHIYDEMDVSPDVNTPRTLCYDGQERLVEVVERNRLDGGSVAYYHTYYGWTTLGDLSTIIDAHNNRKSLSYDSLRRKVFMDDPDRGTMDYTYDDLGNLIKTTDAKGQEIVYTYDWANRLLAEDYDEKADGADPVDVAYHYDYPIIDPGRDIVHFPAGRLAWVEDLSGQEHLFYDGRGNIIRRDKHVREDPNSEKLTIFTMQFEYDPMNRVSLITYPDSNMAQHSYNASSLTESITTSSVGTIIEDVDYQADGRKSHIAYGNGANTFYEYEQRRRRLKSLTTTAGNGRRLLDYSYDYDSASNILDIYDNRLLDDDDDIARLNTQHFQYDDLYRLAQVRYGSGIGQIDYTYDAIGNMLSKISDINDEYANLGQMQYAHRFDREGKRPQDPIDPNAGPHALISTDRGQYRYDENGNMIEIEDAECEWDYRDRLISYKRGATTAFYTYDYTGRRISKSVIASGKSGLTLYPNRYYEVRPEQGDMKFVFDGDTRIAQIRLVAEGDSDVLYYHGDHLGSSNVTTGRDGACTQEMAYYPFGYLRKDVNPHAKNAYYSFAAKEKDAESDLQYFEARYLAVHLGRFLRVDPRLSLVPNDKHGLVKGQSLNPYIYAVNCPLRYIDPTGWEEEETIGDIYDVYMGKGTRKEEVLETIGGPIWAEYLWGMTDQEREKFNTCAIRMSAAMNMSPFAAKFSEIAEKKKLAVDYLGGEGGYEKYLAKARTFGIVFDEMFGQSGDYIKVSLKASTKKGFTQKESNRISRLLLQSRETGVAVIEGRPENYGAAGHVDVIFKGKPGYHLDLKGADKVTLWLKISPD